jgi:hypothetical protein
MDLAHASIASSCFRVPDIHAVHSTLTARPHGRGDAESQMTL